MIFQICCGTYWKLWQNVYFQTRKCLKISHIDKHHSQVIWHHLVSFEDFGQTLSESWHGTYWQLWTNVYFETGLWIKMSKLKMFKIFKRLVSFPGPMPSAMVHTENNIIFSRKWLKNQPNHVWTSYKVHIFNYKKMYIFKQENG